MALTEEQKAANKRRQRIRDRAYHLRRSDRTKREAQLDAEVVASPEAASRAAAQQAFDTCHENYHTAREDLRRQISELQAKIDVLDKQHQQDVQPLKQAREAAWMARSLIEAAARAKLDAEFPDLKDRWSPSGWTAPVGSDYMARAEAEIDGKDVKAARRAKAQ